MSRESKLSQSAVRLLVSVAIGLVTCANSSGTTCEKGTSSDVAVVQKNARSLLQAKRMESETVEDVRLKESSVGRVNSTRAQDFVYVDVTSNAPWGSYHHTQYQVCGLPDARLFQKGLIHSFTASWCAGRTKSDSQFELHYEFNCGKDNTMLIRFILKPDDNCRLENYDNQGTFPFAEIRYEVTGPGPYCVQASGYTEGINIRDPQKKWYFNFKSGQNGIACGRWLHIWFGWQQGWGWLQANSSTIAQKFPGGLSDAPSEGKTSSLND